MRVASPLRPLLLRCGGASLLMGGWAMATRLALPMTTGLLTPFVAGALWILALGALSALSGSAPIGRCLPCWGLHAWRRPADWSRQLALLAMLPMMAALPVQGLLCRAGGASLPATLLLHWIAMFGPALLLAATGRAQEDPSARRCAPVYLAGLAGWALLPDARGDLVLTLALGVAWSLSWAAEPRAAAASRVQAPLGRAGRHLIDAGLLLALGGLVTVAGPDLLRELQLALAVAGALAALLARTVASAELASTPPIPVALR